MEYFVRRAGKTQCSSIKYEQECIPTVTLKDCQRHGSLIGVGDVFVEPGVIISQKHTIVTGTRPNGFKVFSFEKKTTLHQFIIDHRRLFALDNDRNAHIYHFNGTTPEIHDMRRQPIGWCIVPKTRMMVTWDALTLRVYNPDTNEDLFLKGHQARVTTAVAGEAIVATGDSQGFVCIWYVSSWKCFHKLQTGDEDVLQIVVSDTALAVRTPTNIYQYDITTGKKIFDMAISARSIVYNQRGLVVASDNVVQFFVKSESTIAFEASGVRLVTSVHTRCWCLHDRQLMELDLLPVIEKWPAECLKWISNPTFPFQHTWPSVRYMDVLALSAEEWLPKVTHWVPPKQWFRHELLKNALWQWTVKHDMSFASQWLSLPHRKLRPWFQLCMQEIENRTVSFEYSEHVMDILEHLYRRTKVRSDTVLKWCWFHHGRLRMRPIIMRLVENNVEFLTIIAAEPASPTTILCFHPTTLRLLLLEHGHVATFLRFLDTYHTRFLPSDETRKIFQYIVTYVFTNIDLHNCDVPLPETGTWETKTRFMPLDVGKYIKTDADTGFITSVIHHEDEQTVLWRPSNRDVEIRLEENAHIWSLYFKQAPKTLIECALTLLNKDKWSSTASTGPFKWFQSELGAFMSTGQSIHIFDKTMRIQTATWNSVASIKTSLGMTVLETEGLPVEIDTPEWSYIKDATYDLTPLRMKICNIVSKKHLRLNDSYSTELVQCCQYAPIIEEHHWEMNVTVTAAVTGAERLVVGLQNGYIYEFEDLSNFSFPIRSFMLHETPLLSLHIYEQRLLSLSEETLCIWCLKTGRLLFTTTAEQQHVTAVPYVGGQFWVIEHGDYCSATIWDLEDEIPVKKIILPGENQLLSAYHIQNMSVLISTTKVVLWSEKQVEHVYDLNITGAITCVSPTEDGIVGGTTTGNMFLLNFETRQLHEWNGSRVLTAMAPLTHLQWDGIITGDVNGNLSIWNISDSGITTSVSTSPIEHIYVESIFAFVVHAGHINLVSIMQDRAGLTCQSLYNVMTWSYSWKQKLLIHTESIIKPSVHECLKRGTYLADAMDIIEECTQEYDNRSHWCDGDTVELLLETTSERTKLILKRLVAFKGPRIDCPICGDAETKDTVSFITVCHHRFHTRCITEHMNKTPEFHQEMQYEYALSVELKCPTCRAPFVENNLKLDTILNQ